MVIGGFQNELFWCGGPRFGRAKIRQNACLTFMCRHNGYFYRLWCCIGDVTPGLNLIKTHIACVFLLQAFIYTLHACTSFCLLWHRIGDIRHTWAEFHQNIIHSHILFKISKYQSYWNTWCMITSRNYVSSDGESWPTTITDPYLADSCRIWHRDTKINTR